MPSRADTRILVVDDDVDIRESLAELLSDEGYAVVSAPNGREALAVLDSAEPAVILLDLMMPVMDGAEFLEQLSRRKPAAPPSVLVLSAATNPDPGPAKHRAHGVLRKPLDVEALLGAIERATPPA
jgi:two-component system, chemotaxis family, chemotaxis protein CheY